MSIGKAVIKPIKDALDDLPRHTGSLRGLGKSHRKKNHDNKAGVKEVDKFTDKPKKKPKWERPRNPDGTVDRRPYLKPGSRPSLRKKTILEVWADAVRRSPDGKVRDPNPPFEVIKWKPGQGRRDVWDMGHVPQAKYHEMWQSYVRGEMTPKQFRDWYNTASNYRPEVPSKNRSHKFE